MIVWDEPPVTIIPISLCNFNFDTAVVALHGKPLSELNDDWSLIAMIIRSDSSERSIN